jgi:hypothetical protein
MIFLAAINVKKLNEIMRLPPPSAGAVQISTVIYYKE